MSNYDYKETNKRLPGLDFLRAFAALWVFVFHFMEIVPNGLKPSENSYYMLIGWNGVDLFFVLSGFLIGGILCRENENVKSFIIRRLFRIYPAYILTVFLCIFFTKPYLADNFMLVMSHVFLFNNLIPGYGGAVNGVLWTLGAEFQFYIVAAFILFLPRGKYLWLYLISAMITTSLIYKFFVLESIENQSERFFYSTQLPGMLSLFGMGFLAVQLKKNLGKLISRYFPIFLVSSIGFLYVFCEWLRPHITNYWGNDGVVLLGRIFSGLTFSYIVLVFACAPQYLEVAFKKSGLVFVGEISYGIYLTHLFVIEVVKPYEGFFMQFSWGYYGAFIVSLTFISSCLIYFIVEKPFIRLGARIAQAVSKPRFRSTAAIGVIESLRTP